jgi:hypothetical protein
LIEHGNVRHALKEVLLFTTPLLSQIPLQGIECYLSFFGLVDSFYPGGLLGQCVGHYSTVWVLSAGGKHCSRIPAVLNPKTSSATEYNIGICLVVPFCYLLFVGNCSLFPTQWLFWLWLFSTPK